MPGRLIVVEGLDGTGKTTLSRNLADALGAVWMTTPSPFLRRIRARCERLLAARVEVSQLFHAVAVLVAGLFALFQKRRGRDVVIDRYWLSTCVYARAGGSRLTLAFLRWLVPSADMTVLVELGDEERRERLHGRGLTDADAATLCPNRADLLSRSYREGIETPVAGKGLALDVSGLDPEGTLRATLHELRAFPKAGISDGEPRARVPSLASH